MTIRKSNRSFGDEGEKVAAAFLSKHGYEIIYQNYQIRRGEIDIICRKDDVIIFTEIKSTRKDLSYQLEYRVNVKKQKRIYLAAISYIQQFNPNCESFRFDVLLMKRVLKNEWKINHIEDAFKIDEMEIEF